jgi:hypothetical protein
MLSAKWNYPDTRFTKGMEMTYIAFDQVAPSPFCRAGWELNMELSAKARAGHARNLFKNRVYAKTQNKCEGGALYSTYRLRVTIINPEISIPDELKPSAQKVWR